MQYDPGLRLVGNGIQLGAIAGGNVEAVVVEGDELGIIVLEAELGPLEDRIEFVIGVEEVVVVSGQVLEESTGGRKLLLFLFSPEGAVLEFLGFFDIQADAILPGCRCSQLV